jgi:2-hydroxycyclohexanecarboxyl-CoA dehydrogenase
VHSDFSLKDKRILVTGAASGIGLDFATFAAEDGARLALLDINEDGLQKVVGTSDADAHAFPTDLTDWAATEQSVAAAIDALGGLDVVCSIAGWDAPGRFWEQPMDLWHKLVDINLWGPLHVARATVPHFVENRAGNMVFVSSDAGRVGSKGETVYAAAKAGVMGLTKSLAREMATFGVTVNCLCPGPTRTPLLEQEAIDNPKLIEALNRAIPMKRPAEPRDQTRVIAFLASDAAGYMTGQIVSASGGLTMVG